MEEDVKRCFEAKEEGDEKREDGGGGEEGGREGERGGTDGERADCSFLFISAIFSNRITCNLRVYIPGERRREKTLLRRALSEEKSPYLSLSHRERKHTRAFLCGSDLAARSDSSHCWKRACGRTNSRYAARKYLTSIAPSGLSIIERMCDRMAERVAEERRRGGDGESLREEEEEREEEREEEEKEEEDGAEKRKSLRSMEFQFSV